MTTEQIKALIPGWLDDAEVERVRPEEFVDEPGCPAPERAWFTAQVRNPANWKRETKTRATGRGGWLREFDCRPLDSQLRLYVYTDDADARITGHAFVGE